MAELNLSRQIVSRRCLEKAIAAYHDLAAFHVTETLKGWSIVFSGCRYGEKRTIEEFENYLICLEATEGAEYDRL